MSWTGQASGRQQHHQPVDRRGPRPDPRQRRQRGVDLVVVERRQAVDVQRAVVDRRRERPRVARLLAAEPDGQELRVVEAEERSRASAGRPRARSRSNAACAEASETCCSRIRWTRVGKPGSRAHSGRRPEALDDRRRARDRRPRARRRRPAAATRERRRDGDHASHQHGFGRRRCIGPQAEGRADRRGVRVELRRVGFGRDQAGLSIVKPSPGVRAKHVQVGVEHLLERRLAVGQEQVHALAREARSPEGCGQPGRDEEQVRTEVVGDVRERRRGAASGMTSRWPAVTGPMVEERRHAIVAVDERRLFPPLDDRAEHARIHPPTIAAATARDAPQRPPSGRAGRSAPGASGSSGGCPARGRRSPRRARRTSSPGSRPSRADPRGTSGAAPRASPRGRPRRARPETGAAAAQPSPSGRIAITPSPRSEASGRIRRGALVLDRVQRHLDGVDPARAHHRLELAERRRLVRRRAQPADVPASRSRSIHVEVRPPGDEVVDLQQVDAAEPPALVGELAPPVVHVGSSRSSSRRTHLALAASDRRPSRSSDRPYIGELSTRRTPPSNAASTTPSTSACRSAATSKVRHGAEPHDRARRCRSRRGSASPRARS